MFKKLVWAGIIAAGLGGLMFGRDVVSYVSTGAGCIKDSVRESVPVRFEFQRARNLVESLDPEIRNNMHLIAKEEVEIERLRNQITRLDSAVQQDTARLTRLTEDLQSGDIHFVYAGRRYSHEQVKADVAHRFNRVKMNDATLENLRKVLTARETRLEAARQKLEQTVALKRQALVEIENLEARQKMVEVASTAQELALSFDSSQMSRTRALLDDLATRIEVAERMVDSEGTVEVEIPVDAQEAQDIVDEVAAYLRRGTAEIATVADLRSN